MDLVLSKQYIEENRVALLKEKGYDPEKIKKFRQKIQKVSKETAEYMGLALIEKIGAKPIVDLVTEEEIEKEILMLILAGADLETKNTTAVPEEDIELSASVMDIVNEALDGRKRNIKTGYRGDTSLLMCAKKGFYKRFFTLVMAGANINARNDRLSTAVMWSARNGYVDILQDLILLGADLNLKSLLDGDTAMHSAARHNQVECVKMLIAAGVSTNILNDNNKTPLDLANEETYSSTPFNAEIYLDAAKLKKYEEMINILTLQKNIDNPPQYTEELIQEEFKRAQEKLKFLKAK